MQIVRLKNVFLLIEKKLLWKKTWHYLPYFIIINAQTPITNASFQTAINTCLGIDPINGNLVYDNENYPTSVIVTAVSIADSEQSIYSATFAYVD